MRRARNSDLNSVFLDKILAKPKFETKNDLFFKTNDNIEDKFEEQLNTGDEFSFNDDVETSENSIPIDKSFLEFGDDFVTFSVNKVQKNSVRALISGKQAFDNTFDQLKGSGVKRGSFEGLKTIEDWSLREDQNERKFLSLRVPAVVNVFDVAWNDHLHLSLSPSDFLIMIGQGLAYHINANAEKLRKHFVDHEGKEDLIIQRDDLRLGKNCDWSTMFGDFSKELKKRVKKNVYDVVIDDTSVATPLTRVVSEIMLMDCFKSYYRYITVCGCGFPKITLRGTPEDWKKLEAKVKALQKMDKDKDLDLNWWLKELVPVVNKICEAGIDRKIDRTFWSNAYVRSKGYMEELVGGWINAFIPYNLRGKSTSVIRGRNPDFTYKGIDTKSYREGISKVPFLHVDLIKKVTTPLEIYAGFLGGKYDKSTDTVSPHYFWCIAPESKKEGITKAVDNKQYFDDDEDDDNSWY